MKLKLLIHVNEPEKWPVAAANITNFLNDVGEGNAEVVVVANGAGVKGYVSEKRPDAGEGAACTAGICAAAAGIEDLARKGVLFCACRNALRANNIAPESLPALVKVVPAGMTEMVRLQAEGFAYIKP